MPTAACAVPSDEIAVATALTACNAPLLLSIDTLEPLPSIAESFDAAAPLLNPSALAELPRPTLKVASELMKLICSPPAPSFSFTATIFCKVALLLCCN